MVCPCDQRLDSSGRQSGWISCNSTLAFEKSCSRSSPISTTRPSLIRLEGLTDLNEILVAIVRSALDDEALAAALSTRLGEMKARLDRLARRAKSKRSLVLDTMTRAELKKIVEPDFTISVRMAARTVEVIEEDRIPDDYWKPQPSKLDRQRLLGDLKHGIDVAGAQLAPQAQQLSVRVNELCQQQSSSGLIF